MHPLASTTSDWAPGRVHLSRLMKIWRSAGWPCRDPIELDLIMAGLVQPVNEAGHEALRLTPAGMATLGEGRQRHLRAMNRHDKLAHRVARQLLQAGRLVWLELSLRAQVPTEGDASGALGPQPPMPPDPGLDLWPQDTAGTPPGQGPGPDADAGKGPWRMARPDVFSVRHTSVEGYLQPVIHEVKVSRADLLSDLRHAVKRAAYQWLGSACYYVFPAGMAQANEIPEAFGIWVVHGDLDTGRLEQVRAARHAPRALPFAVWMALAKATPLRADAFEEEAQAQLGAPPEPPAPLRHAGA